MSWSFPGGGREAGGAEASSGAGELDGAAHALHGQPNLAQRLRPRSPPGRLDVGDQPRHVAGDTVAKGAASRGRGRGYRLLERDQEAAVALAVEEREQLPLKVGLARLEAQPSAPAPGALGVGAREVAALLLEPTRAARRGREGGPCTGRARSALDAATPPTLGRRAAGLCAAPPAGGGRPHGAGGGSRGRRRAGHPARVRASHLAARRRTPRAARSRDPRGTTEPPRAAARRRRRRGETRRPPEASRPPPRPSRPAAGRASTSCGCVGAGARG